MKSHALLLTLFLGMSASAFGEQQVAPDNSPAVVSVGRSVDDLKKVELSNPPLMGEAYLHFEPAFSNQVIILERNGVSYAFTERDRRNGFYYIGLKTGDVIYLAPQNETLPKLQERIDNLKFGGEILADPDKSGELEIIDFVPKIKWTLTEATPSPTPQNTQPTAPPSPNIPHNDQGNPEANVTPSPAREAEAADAGDHIPLWPLLLTLVIALAAVLVMVKAQRRR